MEKNIIMLQYQGFRRIKRKGFTYDFNLHEDDIVKNPIIKLYTFTDMKEIQIQMVVYGITTKSGKMVFLTGFAAIQLVMLRKY
jgi:hypothetical protein